MPEVEREVVGNVSGVLEESDGCNGSSAHGLLLHVESVTEPKEDPVANIHTHDVTHTPTHINSNINTAAAASTSQVSDRGELHPKFPSQNAQDVQGRFDSGADEVGRDTSHQLGSSRVSCSSGRVAGGEGHPEGSWKGANPSSCLDHSSQRSLQEEGQSPAVHGGAAGLESELQRDDPPAPTCSTPEDLHGDRASWRGPSRVRSSCSQVVSGADDDQPGVHHMGCKDLEGGRLRLQAGPSGPLGRGGSQEAKVVTSRISQEGRRDGSQGGKSRKERCEQGFVSGLGDVSHKFADPADQRDDLQVDRGGDVYEERRGQSQGRASPQEGEVGDRLGVQHDQQAGLRQVLSSSEELSSAELSSCKDPSVFDCSEHVEFRECQEGKKVLNDTTTQRLQRCSDHMIPEALQSLAIGDRVRLLEVACAPDSILSTTMQQLTGSEKSAQRCAHWNQCDLGTNAGVRRVLGKIDSEHPEHVWLSPECGPYSIMQNINQRTEEQRANLAEKRREVLKQYVGCSLIFHYCVQKGIHVTWEWSQTCQAWRLPLIQKLTEKYHPFLSVIRGCQVNLRDDKGQFIQKGWKIMTTHELLSQRMTLPCRCDSRTVHVRCEGSLTRKTAFYTKEFAKRVCQAILQGSTKASVSKELLGSKPPVEVFGLGTMCQCFEGKQHDASLTCAHCCKQHDVTISKQEEAHVNNPEISDARKEEIKRKLYLIHAATGHGALRHLIQAMKRRQAPAEVIRLAEEFRCPVCEERSRPRPRNLASLEPQPPKWMTVSCDMGTWFHTATGAHHQFVVCIDEGSRFRIGRMISTGKKGHVSAQQFLTCFRENWTQYFGNPHTLRVDPDGTFRSHDVANYCDRYNIFLDIVAGEAHWKIGVCEQAIQGVKTVMDKLVADDPDISAADALSEAVRTFNNRELVRGYTPIQHALGRAPDELGRFFQSLPGMSPDLLVERADGEMARNHQRTKIAEQAFLDWTNDQRLQRATCSKARRKLNFSPGDLVYIWRHQLPLKTSQRNTGGRFIGPARILAVEKRRDSEGDLVAGSAVWLVRGRRLLKCCPEQLRHASQREILIDELHSEDPTPWEFTKVSRQLGGNDFDDISMEVPTEEEWRRAGDAAHEWQPHVRLRGKRSAPVDVDNEIDMDLMEEFPEFPERDQSSSSRPRRLREPEQEEGGDEPSGSRRRMTEGFIAAPPWWEHAALVDHPEGSKFWESAFSAVEVSIEMPSTRTGTEKVLPDLKAFLASALKRKAVEVYEKNMDPDELAEFKGAKGVEVSNFLAAKAFEALPNHLKPDRSQVVKMRWVLTWKHKDDGTKKAKARAVLLGFQDPRYAERATMAPTTTRLTRQIQLQISASKKFKVWKGDVTGAFLQGRPYPDELYCIPCKEILEAMGLPPESMTRVKRACYGLVDAPLEWYRTVSNYFDSLGMTRTWSDPCCWIFAPEGNVRGVISAHLDDFVFSGSEDDQSWNEILKKIRTEFRWSDWETNAFVQCGVYIEQHSDLTISLSQEKYVDDLKYINVRASRKRDKHAPTDDYEKGQLRSLLGGISWHAQQVAPHFSSEVGLLLSEINHSQVDTLFRANKLLEQVKNMKTHRLKVHRINLENVGLFAWCDAAAQNRWDGSSTAGIVIGASDLGLLKGQVEKVTLLAWHSSKITRVCRSPGASEAIAAVNAEDLLYFVRFQFQEMLGTKVNVRTLDRTVNLMPGCVITDSRNVYDKLSTEVLCMRGAEKRTDLELLSLKDAQLTNKVQVRWVHSEAQLANSLTKAKEMRQLNLYYDMKQSWCIVEDSYMSSARKRKQQGIDTFTHRNGSEQHNSISSNSQPTHHNAKTGESRGEV